MGLKVAINKKSFEKHKNNSKKLLTTKLKCAILYL